MHSVWLYAPQGGIDVHDVPFGVGQLVRGNRHAELAFAHARGADELGHFTSLHSVGVGYPFEGG